MNNSVLWLIMLFYLVLIQPKQANSYQFLFQCHAMSELAKITKFEGRHSVNS